MKPWHCTNALLLPIVLLGIAACDPKQGAMQNPVPTSDGEGRASSQPLKTGEAHLAATPSQDLIQEGARWAECGGAYAKPFGASFQATWEKLNSSLTNGSENAVAWIQQMRPLALASLVDPLHVASVGDEGLSGDKWEKPVKCRILGSVFSHQVFLFSRLKNFSQGCAGIGAEVGALTAELYCKSQALFRLENPPPDLGQSLGPEEKPVCAAELGPSCLARFNEGLLGQPGQCAEFTAGKYTKTIEITKKNSCLQQTHPL